MARKLLLAPCGCGCGSSSFCAYCAGQPTLLTNNLQVQIYLGGGAGSLYQTLTAYHIADCVFQSVCANSSGKITINLSVNPPTISVVTDGTGCSCSWGSCSWTCAGLVLDTVNSKCDAFNSFNLVFKNPNPILASGLCNTSAGTPPSGVVQNLVVNKIVITIL